LLDAPRDADHVVDVAQVQGEGAEGAAQHAIGVALVRIIMAPIRVVRRRISRLAYSGETPLRSVSW
jgi:hypothetical protein